jgi:DNA-binding transcriptional MerR regulator
VSSTEPKPYPEDERLFGIAEVSRITGLKAFVLRYWESEFRMLEPVKSHNKHRMYRQQDVDLVLTIKRLLYEEGFTIAGARRHLEDLAAAGDADAPKTEQHETGSQEHQPKSEQPPTHQAPLAASVNSDGAPMSREALLELRDALRGFLTLLERK